MPEKRAVLALADGTVYEGVAFGYEGESYGEVVFNTGMTGYQEVLTDPSYKGQIVTMTYPEIGNTGITPEDVESNRPWVEGFVVKEAWPLPSNWRHVESLDSYLRRYRVCGIAGIDTRALTRRLRDGGSQMAALSTADPDPEALAEKAKELPSIVGRDLVREVTSDRVVRWSRGNGTGERVPARLRVPLRFGGSLGSSRSTTASSEHPPDAREPRHQRVRRAGVDRRGRDLSMPPTAFSVERAGRPGRGAVRVEAVRKLLGRCDVRIGLGHQSWGWRSAAGPSTEFGHHGCNLR
jgi:carbamoyl-phosphate synthase small subunit